MESQSQIPEFRNNPENFHPCLCEFLFVVVINVLSSFQSSC